MKSIRKYSLIVAIGAICMLLQSCGTVNLMSHGNCMGARVGNHR